MFLEINLAVRVLMAVVTAIAVAQFASSLLTEQSRWKGGGFGMYTEPHPIKRKIWLVLETDAGTRPVPVWPAPRWVQRQISGPQGEHVARLLDEAYLFATSASETRKADLLDAARAIDWAMSGEDRPSADGTIPLTVTGVRVDVFDIRFDIGNRRVSVDHVDFD